MLKIYIQGKFVNFESFRSGIFQIEFSLFNEKTDFNNLNFCVANSQRLYDNTDINENPIAFFKTLVEEKKEANLNVPIINQLKEDLSSFIVNNSNKFLNLDNLKEIYIQERIEEDLKTLINKRISSQVFNSNANRFAFLYIVKSLNEQQETELKKKHFNSEEKNSDDDIFQYEDENVNYKKYNLVLSPSKGIFIFLLEPGDIIFVKPSINQEYENEDEENEDEEVTKNNFKKKQEILANTPSLKATVKSVNFGNDISEIIISLDDGSLGIVEEKEMVKVKGIKPRELKLEKEIKKKKLPTKRKELKRNLITLFTIIVVFIFIIYILNTL